MHELNTKEIEQISLDIEQQGLTYTPLQNELLDHICCQVERLMEKGLTFNVAYRKVKSDMGKRRIRQIQHETLILISKKYRRMKRTMYAFGVAAPIFLMAGIAFKIFNWPGAGIIISLALLITSLVFLPLFAMVRIRDTRQQDEPVPMGLYITGMIAGMLSVLGALLKIQHMAGSGVMLILGLSTLALVFLPIYASVRKKEAESKNETFNSRLIIGGVIAGSLVILGAMFKVMHWPGAGIVLLVSWSLTAVILLPILVMNQLKQKENKINNFIIIVLVAVSVSILIMARLRSEPWPLLQGYHIPGQNLISNSVLLEAQSDRILNNDLSTASEQVAEQMKLVAVEADKLCTYIQEVKIEMVRDNTNTDDEAIDENGNIDLESIYYQSGSFAARKIIVERDEYKLYYMLEKFNKLAMDLSNDEALVAYIKTATKNHSPDKKYEKLSPEEIWADYCIVVDFPRTLNTLSMYQSTVRMIEYQLLTELQSRDTEQ
jgi:hypothetical protein